MKIKLIIEFRMLLCLLIKTARLRRHVWVDSKYRCWC